MSATSVDNAGLDSEELLHLAIKASETDNHDAAISYLKRAIELAPDNPRAHYMLGAEHAEIGMFDRAVADMQRAVDLGIDLPATHFQLGLLHITSGQVQEAINAWKPLDKLGPEHPLYLFKTGMIHLANDEFPECIAALEKGVAANNEVEALNRDMRGILEQVQSLSDAPPPAQIPADNAANTTAQHILLSAYQRGSDNDQGNE